MNKDAEILIVDDVPNAAEDFGALIATRYKLKVITSDNPDIAINIVKTHPIKVVVIDQKMPLMKGTELFKKINAINPFIKAIMLSGEADTQEVSEAYGLGYGNFLEKTNIGKLPEKVYELYLKFEIDFAKQFEVSKCPVVLSYGNTVLGNIFPGHVIKFHIFSIERLDDNFIFQEKWITGKEIHAGETIEYEESYSLEETVTVNEDFEHKLKTEFSLSDKKLSLLKVNINNEINRKLSLGSSSKKIIQKKSKVTYSLPGQPTDLSENYIVKRLIEYTPVYWEFKGIICRNCSFCGKDQPMPIIFYKQTKKIATRQVNIFKNSQQETISTGVAQYF